MVPIDNINAQELLESGQLTVDQMLNFSVPSFNSSHQTISDATAHFDPSELRNMGPSRTLVLVNGKRKNQSALVYVNDTPGKGEVGVDMKTSVLRNGNEECLVQTPDWDFEWQRIYFYEEPIWVGKSKATDRPVCPLLRRYL